MKEEKYIKDTLSGYESPMDMEATWADLENILDGNKKKKRGFWIWRNGLLLGLALLLVGALALWVFMSQSNTNQTLSEVQTSEIQNNTATQLNITTTSPIKTEELPSTQTTATSNSNSNQKVNTAIKSVTQTATQKSNQEISQPTNKIQPTKLQEPVSKKTQLNSNPESKESSSKNTIPAQNAVKENAQVPTFTNQVRKTRTDEQIKTDERSTISTENKNLKSQAETRSVINFDQLASLGPETLDWDRALVLNFPSILIPQPPTIRVRKPKHKKWRLSSSLAVTRSYFDFATSSGPSLVDSMPNIRGTYTGITKPGLGVALERITKNGLKLSIGLNYLNHAYNHSITDTFLSTEQTNVVRTEVYISDSGALLGTGEGETVVCTKAYEWQHDDNVNLHSFQVPVMLGLERKWGNLDYSFSVGPALNYVFKQSTLLGTSDELITFYFEEYGVDFEPVFPIHQVSKLLLAGAGKLELGYHFPGNMRVFTALEASRSFGNFAHEEFRELNTKINNYGIRTGLSINF